MASLRMRTPAEYLLMLWRRRYFILVPMVIVTATLGYVIYRLPNMYESTTLIIVDAVKVNDNVAMNVNQVDIASRLGQLRNLIMSRTGLNEMIEVFNLYEGMRRAKAPEEMVLEEMNRHVNLTMRNTGSGANAFTISFRNTEPDVARAVTAELAARLIAEHARQVANKDRNTINHLENQVAELRKNLEKIEESRAAFYRRYPFVIDGNDKNIIGQLNNLSLTRSTHSASIDALRNQIQVREQMLITLKSGDLDPPGGVKETDSQTEAVLRAKLAEAEAKYNTLIKIFTPKHPEVREVAAQIEQYKKSLEDYAKDRENRNSKNDAIKSSRRNPQIVSLEIQIAADKRELEQKLKTLAEIDTQIRQLQEQLNLIPALQQEAQKINRDYLTLSKEYDDMVLRLNEAKRSIQITADLSGLAFRVQDPANLPEAPVAPKRMLLYPFSLILGLAAGLVVALAVEARYLFTVRDARDVEHYMRLPLLVTVPQIVTQQEQRQRMMLRVVQLAGVVLLIVVAIPALVMVLQKSRVLNIFTGAY
jgi:polysaccharide chain length determinant protein (PEP-CTERM system associated)